MTRVLVVDDEPQILRALQTNLRGAGFEVETAATAEEALANAAMRPPDAVILDLVLPDGRGTDVCRELRTWTDVPVIVLSAVGEEREKVAALDAGADDYVTKPFGIDELLARLRAALRRVVPSGEPVIEVGDLRIDLEKQSVHREGKLLSLTPHEFALLRLLRAEPRQAAHPPRDPAGGLGPGLPDGIALHPRLRVAAAAEDRGGPRTAALSAHGARRGLSLRRSGRGLTDPEDFFRRAPRTLSAA